MGIIIFGLKILALALFVSTCLLVSLEGTRAQELDAKTVKSIREQLSAKPDGQSVGDANGADNSALTEKDKDPLVRMEQLENRVRKLENRMNLLEQNPVKNGGSAGITESVNKPGRLDASKSENKKPMRAKERLNALAESCLAGCTIDDISKVNQISQSLMPGSTITLAPGVYKIGKSIQLLGVGSDTDTKPLTLRAEKLGTVRIEANLLVAIRVQQPNWIIENLELVGVCQKDSSCEHAFQLIGPVSNTIIRNNRVREFNSAIKGGGKSGKFANDVLIEGNHIFNSAVRNTGLPVTQIDINGGKRWKVIDNFIADFGKGGGNHTSYAGFLKSNSRNGVFARNLVICEWRHKGGERLGLSFGGGGSSNPDVCEDRDCSTFHTGGLIANNIIMNCSDVGIYLNRSKDTKVYNNTLINTTGIDARFDVTTAVIENNIVLGRIRERDGGSAVQKNNIVDGLFSSEVEFTNPDKGDLSVKSGGDLLMKGALPPEVTTDFCGNPRTPNSATIGAIAYGSGNCDVSARIRRALEGLKE